MTKRLLVATVLNSIIFLAGSQGHADNELTGKYISRPKNEINIHLDSSIISSSTRRIINLNGTWQARKEGDEAWTEILVPGAYDFEGGVEFRRSFTVDSSFSGYWFKFVAFGINNRCRIFLNDSFLGSHEGSHTPFTLEIDSQIIQPGMPNEIVISVDNSLDARHTLPLKNTPQLVRNYGGIFRDVFILAIPATSIEDFSLKKAFADDFSKCELSITASLIITPELRENGEQVSLRIEILDFETQRVIARASEVLQTQSGVHKQEITLGITDFQLWTPEAPKLYVVQITLLHKRQILDEVKRKVGFNEFQVVGQQFHLNGQPFVLQGVDWFEDYGAHGPSAGWNTIKEEVMGIKELGVNTIRVVGQPPHPYFLEICNQLGMLVFLEIPLRLVPKSLLHNSDFINLVRSYIRDLTSSASHHPSVAAWGLGEDYTFEQDHLFSFLNILIKGVNEFSEQPVYLVSRFVPLNLPESVDFGIVAYINQDADALENILSESMASKPMVLSTGYSLNQEERVTLPGSGGDDVSHHGWQTTEESQAFRIGQVLSSAQLQGDINIFVYTFNDWRGSRPNLVFGKFKDPLIYRLGLVNINRSRRIAAEAVRAAFTEKSHLKIPQPTNSEINPNIYPILGLAVVLLFLFNFHRSRRLRGNLRRIFLYPHGFYQELVEKRKVGALHTFLLSIVVWTILSVILSSLLFKYRQSTVLDSVLDLIIISPEVKRQFIWLIWNPLWFLIVSILSFAFLYGFLTLLLRIAAFILGKSLALSQFFSLISWSNACFIWLLPIVPIYYRIINQSGWIKPAVMVLLLFFLWAGVRLFRALKVVYSLTSFKAIILSTILLSVVAGGIGLYYDKKQALFDYVPIYWEIFMKNM